MMARKKVRTELDEDDIPVKITTSCTKLTISANNIPNNVQNNAVNIKNSSTKNTASPGKRCTKNFGKNSVDSIPEELKNDIRNNVSKRSWKNTSFCDMLNDSKSDDDDGDYDPKNELNNNKLVETLTNSLSNHVRMPYDALKNVVITSLTQVDQKIIDDYIDPMDEDNNESDDEIKMVDPVNRKLHENLKMSLKDLKPTLNKILTAPISPESRLKAYELFQLFKNLNNHESDYYKYRNEINELLRPDGESNAEAINYTAMDYEENRIKSLVRSTGGTLSSLKSDIFALDADDKIKACIYEKYMKMSRLNPDDSEYRDTQEWIIWATSLPYRKRINPIIPNLSNQGINDYCMHVLKRLDQELYGMKNVKEQIIQILNNRITLPNRNGTLFGLHGSCGTGKTTIGKALAKIIGVPCEVISVGGMEDASVLKGCANHWRGSAPSIILQIMRRIKCNNGIIVFDEIDKLSGEQGRNVSNALLHITDYTSNKEFRDTFLSEFPHDISNLWFIFTMNDISNIEEALKDRLRPLIKIAPYNTEDKKKIINDYLLPKSLENVGMNKNDVSFTSDGMATFLKIMKNQMSVEGIRPVKSEIDEIVSRINFLRTNTLKDGTLGSLNISYAIPKFKIPLRLDANNVKRLCTIDEDSDITDIYI